jgi:hypothetical protein
VVVIPRLFNVCISVLMMMINCVKIFAKRSCKTLQKTYGKTQNACVDCEGLKWKCEQAIKLYSYSELSSSSQIYKDNQIRGS